MRRSATDHRIAIVVDAGLNAGYGRVVRSLRIARRLQSFAEVTFHPLSEDCARFLWSVAQEFEVKAPEDTIASETVVTDMAEPAMLTACLRKRRLRHISIHDLGLGQCESDVAIDGSIARLIPFEPAPGQIQLVGTGYAVTRQPVRRRPLSNRVFLTLGGGAGALLAPEIIDRLKPLGLDVVATRGFDSRTPMTDAEIEDGIATCRFAVSCGGTSLYDLVASGVPTIAIALDPAQLRAANAFHERRAAISAGLVDRLSAKTLAERVLEVMRDTEATARMAAVAKNLIDGKGLDRVVDAIRRSVKQMKEEAMVTV